jgi:hypothetical protein
LGVIYVLGGLFAGAASRWRGRPDQWLAHWFLAFDTGAPRGRVLEDLSARLGDLKQLLGLPETSSTDVEQAFDFLTMTEDRRAQIEPQLAGPLFPILPMGNTLIIDYAWGHRVLDKLLFGVNPINQNFKGEALEQLVAARHGQLLPARGCNAADGTAKQIDASFRCGDVVVIAECKSTSSSIAYDRGDSAALARRRTHLDAFIDEVTAKAVWLAERPAGRNYALDQDCRWICPIVVTPFVERIPSLDERYWLKTDVARIMTPAELGEFRKSEAFTDQCKNLVPINWAVVPDQRRSFR